MQTKSFQSCGGTFDLQSKKNMIEQMRLKSNKSDFWKDKNSASSLLKDISITLLLIIVIFNFFKSFFSIIL